MKLNVVVKEIKQFDVYLLFVFKRIIFLKKKLIKIKLKVIINVFVLFFFDVFLMD